MSNHTPKQPSERELILFSTWTINVWEGKVYNDQEREIGNARNKANPYQAYIYEDSRKVHLGYFASADLASEARLAHERREIV